MSQEKHDKHVRQMNLRPCEERVEGKLCRKEAVAMTIATGKLLCQEHCDAYEVRWGVKLSRLQMMVEPQDAAVSAQDVRATR